MRYHWDIILGGVLVAVLLNAMTPAGSTSLALLGSGPTAFSESLLLASSPAPLEPSPKTFQELAKINRLVVGQHVVKTKENLFTVGKLYGSTGDYLRSTNHLESSRLDPGKSLLVHNGLGMLHQVRELKGRQETLQEIAKRYNRSAEQIAKANRLPGVALLTGNWTPAGSVIFVPKASLRFTDYIFPVAWVPGKRLISSGYGNRRHPIYRVRRFHSGIDMPRPYGTSVKAAREGTVIFSDWRSGYGRLVIVKHAGGQRTWYGHLSKIAVTPGQRVSKGQYIGNVGSSGISTGPHLHFEVRDAYGTTLNPRKFLP